MSDPVVRSLEQQIAHCKDIMTRTKRIWEKPTETPGWAVTGGSNRPKSLINALDRENARKSKAFAEYQQAEKDLQWLENRLALYKAGEVHANGQKKANSPSAQRRQMAQDEYAAFVRAVSSVGCKLALVDNPRNTITVKRLNAKSVTSDAGSTWKYHELIPLNEKAEAMSTAELKAAVASWKGA